MKNLSYKYHSYIHRGYTLRKIIVFFTFSFFIFHSWLSAEQIGTWKVYPSYTIATYNIPVGQRIYSLMDGKLMAYDTEDGSITTFDWMEQLSDVTISFIRYSADAKRIIIVYDNGNIDLLSTQDDNDVINLAQLKNSTKQNKTVTNVQISGSTAYLCTGFGFVVVDMAEAFIRDSYEIDLSVMSCAVTDKAIYAGTSTGLWIGELSKNLKDNHNWTQFNTNYKAQHMQYFDDCVWVLVNDYLFVSNKEKTAFSTAIQKMGEKPSFMTVSDGHLMLGTSKKLYVFSAKDQMTNYQGDYSWNCLTKKGSTYWASDGKNSLQAYQLNDDGSFSVSTSKIHPNSPLHDFSYHLRWTGDRLMVAGGNRHFTDVSREGTAMIMDADGTWHIFDGASVLEKYPNERWRDVTNIVHDPVNENHFLVGTTRNGIFEFTGEKCTDHITYDNSPLRSMLPDNAHPQWYTVADGLQYDPDGNLWVLNCTGGVQDTTIRILQKNGTWTGIPCPEIKGASTVDNIFFDSRGWAWLNSRRMDARGVFLLNYNGTINNTKDDLRWLSSKIVNQDGTTYSPDEFYYINEDVDGSIWICTNMGPFRITEPKNFASDNFTYEQVKISRNDGSGLADYLLTGLPSQCVTFDGAGRKWFGTADNGVFFISEDCQEELAHFTTDNSPLPSNNIWDIAIHPTTGRVFIATDKGLCSYLSDATEAAEELKKDDIYAFPNPVRPDYTGPIAIRGLVKDCEVKIVSPTGQLITSGTSHGGTFTWNGCNQNGRRVASGVYFVIANTPDGEEAATTKITIFR